jgi:mannose-6-phosphate isomerase-like protein (cupin superfamily)
MATVEPPLLPGGIAVSHLRVYDTPAPDGLAGGTPHVHTVCTEAYAVIAGTGLVQTLTAGGGFAEVPLEPGALVWFTPGTIHRLVNHGSLELFVLMQNAGLPEAGDMFIPFDPPTLADPARYEALAVLPRNEATTAAPDAAARRRRDAGVDGFLRLRAGGPAALTAFHDAVARLVEPRLASWRATWKSGPAAAAEATAAQIDALARGDASHLSAASVHRQVPSDDVRRYGCCGTLGVFVTDG